MPRNVRPILFFFVILILAAPVIAAVPPGRITVYSVPNGARACVNGVLCDTTPATFTVAGNAHHNVTVTAGGYRPWNYDVYVTADQTSLLTAYLDLNPSTTGIAISVSPGGGMVCLDNSDCRRLDTGSLGSTIYTGVIPGYHTVSVDSPAGYSDATRLVQVVPGEMAEVSITLSSSASPVTTASAATGSIRVYVDRTGSTICIDNLDCFVNVGGSPGPGTGTVVFNEVTADVMHIVTVAADGYMPFSARVTVRKDLLATVDVTLTPVTSPATLPATTPIPVTTGLSTTAPATMTDRTTASAPIAPIPTRSGFDAALVPGALVLSGVLLLFRRGRK